jgi:hypothetical protein
MPLSMIFKVEKNLSDPEKQILKDNTIDIITKDFRLVRLTFPDFKHCKSAYTWLTSYVYPDNEYS